MKLIIGSLILMLSHSVMATDSKIIATCGDYKVTYEGESSSYFSGILIKTSVFHIEDSSNQKLMATLELDSEGGKLTSETSSGYDLETGEPLSDKTIIYDAHWNKKFLKVILNGRVIEKIDCK